MHRNELTAIAAVAAACLLGSCAVLRSASKATTVFMGEEDPYLVADTFPLLIKASEIALAGKPKDRDAAVTTASLYVMYASAFLDGLSADLPAERFEERKVATDRAGALYRRAFRLLAPILERRAPGAVAAARDAGSLPEGESPLARLKKADVPLLYWTGASVLAAFGLNPLDFESAANLGLAKAVLERAAELDPGWNGGAIYEIFFQLYASMPDYLGGDRAKAVAAYEKALEYSGGKSPSLFVSYATAICQPDGDRAGYLEALGRAAAIDPNANPGTRLATTLARDKARKLIAGADQVFIDEEEGE